MNHRIRPGESSEAAAISDLALRAKAGWGYRDEQMAVFRGELTLAPALIRPRRTHVLEVKGQLLGFYTLKPRAPFAIELEHLFIAPGHFRRGYGTALFRHACGQARNAAARALVVVSDPNAAGFYAAMGGRQVGTVASSLPDRTLPVFEFELGSPNARAGRGISPDR